ncbi:MAG: OB-fold putative lipoprotein [Treponema sp.]|nr:OB-fold putative lipoprotein [Treponema sp.]
MGIIVIGVVISLLAGCKTTVPVAYTEPARLDLSGVNRVAIDSDDTQIVASVSQKITATGKYTVASTAELLEWKQWKKERQAMEALANHQGQAIEVSSTELVGEYTRNTARADSSYMGKTLKITAIVKEIGSSKGRYFVRLDAGSDSVDVFFVPSEESRLAAVDKGQTITIIGECNGFNRPDLEDTGEILRILGAGRSINVIDATFPVDGLKDYPGEVDAVIFLNTTSSVEDDTHTDKRAAVDSNGKTITDADGNTVYRNVIIYDRSVTVNIDYQVVRTRDSSLIGEGTKSATSAKSSNEDQSKLPAPADLVARTTDKPLNEFASEIIPTQRSISLTLVKEPDNKEAKKEMAEAQKLVKAKNYPDAAAAYGKIYAKYKNFAAGYNQAVLTEVAAGTEAAVGLMETLSKETGNSIAQSTLKGMQDRNAANRKAAAQLSQ